MSTLTIEIPDSLKESIEELAAKEGYSISQFLASAAGEKLAAMMTMDYLRREAASGRREDFDRYLASVPSAPPPTSTKSHGTPTMFDCTRKGFVVWLLQMPVVSSPDSSVVYPVRSGTVAPVIRANALPTPWYKGATSVVHVRCVPSLKAMDAV